MRSVLVLPVALSFVFGIAAAQGTPPTPPTPSRWTFSAGPEWTYVTPVDRLWSMRLRAEYDLTRPYSVFGLRFEGAVRWSPTQSYFYSRNSFSFGGREQRTDLMLGLTGSLSPIPRARFAPYVTMGIFGRQEWRSGITSRSDPFTSSYSFGVAFPPSQGNIVGVFGLGLRARLGGRSFQLEYRRIYGSGGLTFGTRLPF